MTDASTFLEWTNLPDLFKRNVISHLDFINRNALRLCSKEDKKLVDTCQLTLPYLEIAFTSPHGICLKIQENSDSNKKLFLKNRELSHIARIFQLPSLKIQDFSIFCSSRDFYKIPELISLIEKSENFLKVANLYWRCCPPENDDKYSARVFIKFLKMFDEHSLETIHNDMLQFPPEELNILAETNQWKHASTISLANGQVESIEPFLHTTNCTVYFKKLEIEHILKMVQSFLSRNVPIDSQFNFQIENPPKIEEILEKLPAGLNAKVCESKPGNSIHFQMASAETFLVVRIAESGVQGSVQKFAE